MSKQRFINAIPLEAEIREFARRVGCEATNECESTAEYCADMVSEAPTVELKHLRWRNSVSDPPTEADADKFGKIIVWAAAAKHVDVLFWQNVLCYPMDLPFWMPCPESPEEDQKGAFGNAQE